MPNHPALQKVVDEVVERRKRQRPFSEHEDRDVFERLGPGVWTDVLLSYAEVIKHKVLF